MMNEHDQASASPREASSEHVSGSERFLAELQQLFQTAWDATLRLVRQGNRRRLTLRSRNGEVWVRMPLTLAVLLAIVVIPSWPLLLALIVIGFAVGAQLSLDRQTPSAAADEPHPSNGGT